MIGWVSAPGVCSCVCSDLGCWTLRCACAKRRIAKGVAKGRCESGTCWGEVGKPGACWRFAPWNVLLYTSGMFPANSFL
jgi:hypothetical protein